MNYWKLTLLLLCVISLGKCAYGVSIGTGIIVDFGNTGSVPNTNEYSGPNVGSALNNLIDTVGAGTQIDVTATDWAPLNNVNGASWLGGNQDWMSDALGDDHLTTVVPGATGTVTFSEVPAGLYTVEMVSASSVSNIATEILVNGISTNDNADGGSVSSFSWAADQTGQGRDNWLIFNSISPVSGVIEITLRDVGPANVTNVNAVQLTQVSAIPEPSFFGLFGGLLVLGWVLYRGRKPDHG